MAGNERLDAAGHPAPLTAADLADAGARIGPIASQGLLAQEDAYYFSHHEAVVLPVWRVLTTDGRRVFGAVTPKLQEFHLHQWSNLSAAEVDALHDLLAKALWGDPA